jgi:S1-C subfamily serine protease
MFPIIPQHRNTSTCYFCVTFVTYRPDYFLPWQNHPKRESTGTGFVIRDRLILTNAHVVADQTYVTVKRHGSGTKYRAGERRDATSMLFDLKVPVVGPLPDVLRP